MRFPLSLRNVEGLLHERGSEVSHETIRFWWNRFGPIFAAEIRKKRNGRMRALSGWRWHLDEVFVKIHGERHYLWRAVDQEGEVLEAFVSKKRDRKAALKFLRKLMKRYPRPDAIITDYEYRIDQRGDWISIGSTATTHTIAGLVNGTTYVFQVRAVNRIGRSQPSDPVEATPIAQVFLDLAHFANGAGIISEVVLVNVAPHPIRPALYFYDQEGEPIAAESMVDVLGDLGIQEDGGLTIRTEMEPLGELTISTHGRGDLVSGSVKVAAYGTIGGVLRFDLLGIGVAGVQVSQPLRDAIFPVRRREGGIDTGMALHNREEEAAVVSCRLMKNGAVLEEVEITLAANGQVARFIGEVFTGTDTSDFVGLVRCTAEGVAQFTGMALELDAGNRIFTTLPVVKVNRGRAGEAALDFAHFANGASIVSEMVFMNLETQPSGPPLSPFHQAIPPTRPVIYFYDQEGNPIDPALLVDLTGDLEITEDGALSIQSEMEPLGELTISTYGRGELVSGSVRVVSDGPIGGGPAL